MDKLLHVGIAVFCVRIIVGEYSGSSGKDVALSSRGHILSATDTDLRHMCCICYIYIYVYIYIYIHI